MFQNTSYVIASNGFLYAQVTYLDNFGAALNIIYLLGCLRATMVVSTFIGGFFDSSETLTLI